MRHKRNTLGWAAFGIILLLGKLAIAIDGTPGKARVPEAVLRKLATKVVMPEYPESSVRAKKQGVAVVAVFLDENGKLGRVDLIESPDEATGNSAVNAVRQWEFQHATTEGRPIAVLGKITFYFIHERGKSRVENPHFFQRNGLQNRGYNP